jgi:hypothetical protein
LILTLGHCSQCLALCIKGNDIFHNGSKLIIWNHALIFKKHMCFWQSK